MLKRIIDKLEDAPEAVHSFYTADGDKFVLQVDGKPVEDLSALKSAKEHEKNLRVSAESKITAVETDLATAKADLVKVTGERDAAVQAKGADVQALEASWRAKVDAAEAKVAEVTGELGGEISRLLVTNTARALASEISTIPEMFAESVVAKRLVAEKGADGKYFTRVLDADGKPSASTVDDLKKELLANDKYAAIIIAGKGSGGGALGTGPGGGADGKKKFTDYSDSELSELRKTNRPEYDRLLAAEKAPA